jgi:hypothetical protein
MAAMVAVPIYASQLLRDMRAPVLAGAATARLQNALG